MTKDKLFFLLIWLFCSVSLFTQQIPEDPLIIGDEKLFDGRYYTCRGNAELFWKTYHVFADEIVYDTQEKTVRASGRVAMSDKDNIISGDSFQLNIKEMKGEMNNVFGLAPPTVSFRTDQLRQTDKDFFEFDELIFSSCGQLVPDWSIHSPKGKIKKDSYIEMKDVVFKVNLLGGIPLFYLPYLRYPIQKDGRSTGFLFPQIGLSKQKGFYACEAFFWEMGSNADLTLKTDWYEKVGFGLGADLRYMFYGGVKGEISYYHFLHNQHSPFKIIEQDKSDYLLNASHRQKLPFLNTSLSVNVSRESNPMLRQLFSDLFALQQTAIFKTQVKAVSQLLSNLTLDVSAARNETFYTVQKKSNITEYKPSLSLTLSQQKLYFMPGYLNIELTAENLSRSGESIDPTLDELYDWNVSTKRLFFKPRYTLPVMDSSWMNLSLDLASQFQFYNNRKDPKTKKIVDEPLHLEAHSISLNMQGLKLERIFKGLQSDYQHLIYPEISFTYSSTFDEDLNKQVVRIDSQDYSPFSYISFSLRNFIRVKRHDGPDKQRRELMNWSVGIDYYMDPEEANMGRTIDGEYVPWGPVSSQLIFSPTKWLSLNAALYYNIYRKYLTYSMISLKVGKADEPFESSVYYSKSKDAYNPNNIFNMSSLGASLRLNPEYWPVNIQGNLNYNMTQKLLSVGVMLDLKLQCWSVGFGLQQKLINTGSGYVNDLQVQFGVRLGHLSMIQDLLSLRDI